MAEIFRGLQQPGAEICLPNTIHKNARGDRRLCIDQPFCESQARLRITRWERMQERGDVGCHHVLRMGLLTALEEAGFALLIRLGGDEHPGGLRNLRVERFDFRGLGSEGRITFSPVSEEVSRLLRGTFPGVCQQRFEHERRELVEGVRQGRGDREAGCDRGCRSCCRRK